MAYSMNPHLPRVRREAVYLVKQKGWSRKFLEKPKNKEKKEK
jgi:hypothetical protein